MSDDLRRALADPGYTPPRQAFRDMLGLLGDPELGSRVERALLSAGLPAASFAAKSLDDRGLRSPAVARLIGRALRAHDEPELLEALLKALRSAEPALQREAAIALGKSGRAAAEPALLDCLDSGDPKLLRSVIEALGKIGGERSLERLAGYRVSPALSPVLDRARLMLERSLGRSEAPAASLLLDAPLARRCAIVVSCRSGLARFLADEAAPFGARSSGDGEVGFDYAGTLRPLLELRLALAVAIVWPLAHGGGPEQVLEALSSPELVDTLRSWTAGPMRFRLEWQGAGHRRADTWRIARALRESAAPLINDPTRAPWTIEVQQGPHARLLLKPQSVPELRFDYRVRDVPAASHPTLAAALARVGGARDSDVVWDPFAGSGVELIERAKLGAFRELHGTDLDARALSAARQNLERAGVPAARLEQADARTHRITGLTLVLTNPPMGRRVLRVRGLSGVLCQVVRNVAGQLATGGRMVWLSPFPEATARAARDARLAVERLGNVDLGGFNAELQHFHR